MFSHCGELVTLALDDASRVAIQVAASVGLVVAVLFFMWKLPASGERFFGWAPPLALVSAWAGMFAVLASILVWWLPGQDIWIAAILLVLDPAAVCAGVLVMWIYRRHRGGEETVFMQLTQARIGIALAMLAIAIGYVFVMNHKTIFTPVGS